MVELKLGYKLTEVGVIPEDWEVKQLGTCLLHTPQYGINAPAVQYADNLPTYIRITDISEDGRFSPEKLVSVDHPAAGNYFLNEGDLVFARTGASVGKSYLYDPADGKLVYAGFLIRVGIDTSKLIPSYLAHYVKTEQYWNWVKMMSMRSGQPGINGNEYSQLLIPLPPTLAEQRAIANALSEVDDQIAALDDQIAKKRDLKQGAMQRLLTGEERLPGFDGAWKMLNMTKNFSLKARIGWQGLTTAEYLDSGDYYLVTGTDFDDGRIDWENCHYVDRDRYDQDKNIQIRVGDVLLTKDGTIGKVAYIDNLPAEATLNSGVFVIRPLSDDFDPLFLYYVLNSAIFRRFLAQLQAGSTINHLYQKDFVTFEFSAPSFEEQEAVAIFLYDADVEIAALEAQREKTVALKQGMMQDLLTGKVRLV